MVNVLDLISLINLGQCNFHRVELSAVDTHGGKASPERRLVHETAETNDCLEVKFLDMLIQHSGIRRHR